MIMLKCVMIGFKDIFIIFLAIINFGNVGLFEKYGLLNMQLLSLITINLDVSFML